MGRIAKVARWEATQKVLKTLEEEGEWRDLLMIALGCYTGYRPVDIRHFTWGDLRDALRLDSLVLLERKTMHHKGKEKRNVAVHPELRRIIALVDSKLGDGLVPSDALVFRSRHAARKRMSLASKTPISGEAFRLKTRDAYLRIAGVVDICFYSLRKSYGRRYFDVAYEKYHDTGYALQLTKEAFGHKSIDDTERYIGLRQDRVREINQML